MTEFRFPIVVVGSGPTGFALTESLLSLGHAVAVVPGGSLNRRTNNQDLLRGEIDQTSWNHEPLEKRRRMGAGGTGDWWGGRSVLLDPIDFEQRPWVPHSGWPFTYDQYLSFLPLAARTLGIHPGVFGVEAGMGDSLFEEGGNSLSSPFELGLEVWSTEKSFTEKWRKLRASSKSLTFLDGAICTEIALNPGGDVQRLRCSDGFSDFSVEARRYVLATGGLENARLLLLAGLGPHLPALGKYYQAHIWTTAFEFGGTNLARASNLQRSEGVYVRRRWRLGGEIQKEMEIGNAIAFAGRPNAEAPVNHTFSQRTGPSRSSLGIREEQGPARSELHRRARLALHSHLGLIPLWRYGFRRTLGWPPPLLLPTEKAQKWALWFQGEHSPNPSSRVVLSDTVDVFGNARLKMDVAFSEIDFKSVEVFHRLFQAEAESRGFVCADLDSVSAKAIEEVVRNSFTSNSHHSGTTRMGTDKTNSVVDPNLRVHGLTNLFVVGSSVFPTSGHANPTLSAIMLAHRLAEYISEERHDF